MKLQLNKEIQSDRRDFYQRIKPAKRLFGKAINLILPPRCALTGDVVQEQGEIIPSAWAELEFISNPMCKVCGAPFDFEIEVDMECAGCLKHPPEFEIARSALIYNDRSRNIILRFKHADHLHTLDAFMPWVMRAGDILIKDADVIVPIPLHRWRLMKRRYNQAALMAQYMSKRTGVPWSYDTLIRARATKTQGVMKSKERQKNVRGAFAISPSKQSSIDGKNILLVDDVYTTGATVNECAKTLLKAGVASVNVLTIAKVVKR